MERLLTLSLKGDGSHARSLSRVGTGSDLSYVWLCGGDLEEARGGTGAVVQRGDGKRGPEWSRGCGEQRWECKHVFEVRGRRGSRMGTDVGSGAAMRASSLGTWWTGGLLSKGGTVWGVVIINHAPPQGGGEARTEMPVTGPYLYPGERGRRHDFRHC